MEVPRTPAPESTPADPAPRAAKAPDRRVSVLAGTGPLGVAAAFAIVIGVMLGLREIASLVVPILFGLFLALGTWPLVGILERRGAGHRIAVAGSIGVVLLVVLGAGLILALSVGQLVAQAPHYEDRLAELTAQLRDFLHGLGVDVDLGSLPSLLSPGTLANVAQAAAGAVSRAAAAMVVLAFAMIFGLTGAAGLEARARIAFGEQHAILAGVEQFGRDLRRFLLVRAQLGLFAAVLTAVLLFVVGVPLPLLWALLVFAAAFIPNIGTLIALIPPAILAFLNGGIGPAGAVVIGFALINFAQDYLLQPRMMGTELNLTPLVVFISVVAWTWVLGAAGALLAVPLTVGLVAILEAFPESRGVALLLRDHVDDGRRPDLVASAIAAGDAVEDARTDAAGDAIGDADDDRSRG